MFGSHKQRWQISNHILSVGNTLTQDGKQSTSTNFMGSVTPDVSLNIFFFTSATFFNSLLYLIAFACVSLSFGSNKSKSTDFNFSLRECAYSYTPFPYSHHTLLTVRHQARKLNQLWVGRCYFYHYHETASQSRRWRCFKWDIGTPYCRKW